MMDGRPESYLVLLAIVAGASPGLTHPPSTQDFSPSSGASGASLVYMTAGMPGRLGCPVEAEPPNRLILWQKDGLMIDVSDGSVSGGGRSIGRDGTLVIAHVSADDQGRYSCMSYSPLETGYASAAFEVIVKDLHHFTTRPLSVYHRLVGESVLMPCATEGDPQPTISWRKLDGDFPATTKTLQDEGNLTIVQLAREDGGVYACIATNIVTSVITTTLLVVQIKIFAAPFNVTVEPLSHQSARLSWIPPYENGHYVLWFRRKQDIRDTDADNVRFPGGGGGGDGVRRRISGSRGEGREAETEEGKGEEEDWQTMEIVNSNEATSITIYGLRPSTVYSFMVMSRDSRGQSHFSEQVIGTTLQGLLIYGNENGRGYDDDDDDDDGRGEADIGSEDFSSGEEKSECHDDNSCDPIILDVRPSPPLDLSVHLLADSRVNISWSAPRRTMVPVRHYVVEYRTTGGEWKSVIDRLSPRNTSLLWTTPNDDPDDGVFHFRVFSFGGSLHSVATPVLSLITRDETGGEMWASSSSVDVLAWETVGGVVVGLLLFCVSVILAILAVGIYKRRQQPFKQNLMIQQQQQLQQQQQQQQQLHDVRENINMDVFPSSNHSLKVSSSYAIRSHSLNESISVMDSYVTDSYVMDSYVTAPTSSTAASTTMTTTTAIRTAKATALSASINSLGRRQVIETEI